MRLLRKGEGRLVFHLSPAEQQILAELLRRYPCIPPGHHAHTRTTPHHDHPEHAGALQLLEESLEEHRASTRRQVQAWFADPARLRREGKGFQLTLPMSEVERLLQVLNDIRVGSWIALGEPDEIVEDVDPAKVPQARSMELAAYFQMCLLETMRS